MPDYGYSDGTISFTQGGLLITGAGTAWSTQVRPGDIVKERAGDGLFDVAMVASVTNDGAIVPTHAITRPSASGANYLITRGIGWLSGAAPNEVLLDYINRMAGKGLVGVSAGAPDPDEGSENELRVDPTSGVIYQKRAGAWQVAATSFGFDAFGLAAGLDDFDDELEGFTYFATDTVGFYVKLSDGSADWSAFIDFKGPDGGDGDPGSSDVTGTSSSSVAVGTGSKAFTVVEADRGWSVGARLRIASSANPTTNWMEGVVTAYSGTSLTVTVDVIGGSGTIASWTINLAGARGAAGAGAVDSVNGQTGVVVIDIREKLTANRTYYVRTDGSDSNSGLVDSSGGAFLTIQKAINVAVALDLSTFAVTIQVRSGTYTGSNALKSYIGVGPITIVGDETTPSNVVISTTSADCFGAASVIGQWRLRGMKLQTTTSGQGIEASGNSLVSFQNIDFGACASGHILSYLGASVDATGNYSISGGSTRHIWLETQGRVNIAARTVTITGTPAFSVAFVYAAMLTLIQANGMTFSGSATGKRYQGETNSVIYVGGAATTYLPGDVTGTVATGAQYA